MGKVQDTLSRLTGRSEALRQRAKRLGAPSQQVPGADSFPVEPAQVALWLDRHRPFDRSQNIRALTTALQHSNRLRTPPEDRLAIMALYEAPVRWALAILNARHPEFALPASSDAIRNFNDIAMLQQEMASGYKLALIDSLQGRIDADRCSDIATAAMRHLSACCLKHLQAYRRWPDNRWLDLHTLYAIADDLGNADAMPNEQTSVRTNYLKLCTLAISQVHRLQPAQMLALDAFLDTASPALINTAEPHDLPQGSCYLTLAADTGPMPWAFANANHTDIVAAFDITTLLDRLDDLSHNGSSINRSTQNRLHQIWQGNARRQLPRATRSKTVAIESGLRNLHAIMDHYTPSSEPFAHSLDEIDLSQFLDQTVRQPKPVENAMTTGDYGAQWIVENDNRRGLGLRWTGQGRCQMRVGELIGHTYQSHQGLTQWHMGVCRWLDSLDDDLTCGVETISTTAIAVMVLGDNAIDQPGEAIMLNHDATATGPAMLLLPVGQFERQQQVNVLTGDQLQPVLLAEKINLSNRFDCFGVTPVAQEVKTSEQQTAPDLVV
jgi:hypothetical protein